MKRSSLKIFFSVVKALLLREIQTRFGSQKLGYLWAVVEPMAMILVFAYIHKNIGTKTSYDMATFLAVSFVSYNLFKNIIFKNIDAFNANKSLFVYKQIKPFDTLISRALLEGYIQIFVTIVLIVIGYYFNINMEVKNLLGVILGILWFGLFGFSLSVLFAVLNYFFENFGKIVRLMFLPMFFISGLFYTADTLPSNIRDILLFNPVFQFEEMVHGYYFYSLSDKYVNYTYIALWTIIPLFLGLWLYKKVERKIIMS